MIASPVTLDILGDVVRSLGRPAEAKDLYDRAIAVGEPRVGQNPTDLQQRYYLVGAIRRRGLARRDLGDSAGAAADTRRALALCDGLPPRSGRDLFETACCHAALAGLAGRAAIGRLGRRGGDRGRPGDGMARPGGRRGLPECERNPDRVGPGPAPLPR